MKRLATLLCAWLLALATVASPILSPVIAFAPASAYASVTLTGAGKVPASGGSFNPASTNPDIWIDPRTGVTCTVAPCNGTNITLSAIANQGSLGTSLTPASPTSGSYTATDSLANNLPTIRTIGGNGYLIGNANVTACGSTCPTLVIVLVVKVWAASGNMTALAVAPSGFASGYGVELPASSAGLYVAGDVYGWGNSETPFSSNPPQVDVASGGATSDTTAYHIYGVILSSTSGNLRVEVDGVNKSPLSTGSAGAVPSVTGPITLGVFPGSANYDISYAQAFVVRDNTTPLTTLHNLEQWAGCTYHLNYNGSIPSCP